MRAYGEIDETMVTPSATGENMIIINQQARTLISKGSPGAQPSGPPPVAVVSGCFRQKKKTSSSSPRQVLSRRISDVNIRFAAVFPWFQSLSMLGLCSEQQLNAHGASSQPLWRCMSASVW